MLRLQVEQDEDLEADEDGDIDVEEEDACITEVQDVQELVHPQECVCLLFTRFLHSASRMICNNSLCLICSHLHGGIMHEVKIR